MAVNAVAAAPTPHWLHIDVCGWCERTRGDAGGKDSRGEGAAGVLALSCHTAACWCGTHWLSQTIGLVLFFLIFTFIICRFTFATPKKRKNKLTCRSLMFHIMMCSLFSFMRLSYYKSDFCPFFTLHCILIVFF